jgi:hypothetical protein
MACEKKKDFIAAGDLPDVRLLLGHAPANDPRQSG